MSKIEGRNEHIRPGDEVELFMLDLAPIGYPTVQFYFQQADGYGRSIWFGNKEYVPRPIQITGFKKSSEDAPPEPTMSFGNLDKGGYALLKEYGDLLGAKLVRLVTYGEFLDRLPDGLTPNPSADSSATQVPEIWFLEQPGPNTRSQIVFRLKSIMDLRDKKIPNRDVLKTVCRRPYRVWNFNKGGFDYPAVAGACPYAGAHGSFNRATIPVADPFDDCGKDPPNCLKRFPDQPLPGWFFPGVRRIGRNG